MDIEALKSVQPWAKALFRRQRLDRRADKYREIDALIHKLYRTPDDMVKRVIADMFAPVKAEIEDAAQEIADVITGDGDIG